MAHALIVDAERHIVESLESIARAAGFTTARAATLREARIEIGRQQPDVLFAELRLPDGDGVELAQELEHPDSTELIVITGHASFDGALAALRLGASDYLVKPVDPERVAAVLRRAGRTSRLCRDVGELRGELRRLGRFGRMLGSSPPMQALYAQIERVAPTSATVLLVGESGTGKELAAQTIHEMSRRRSAPFLPVNCGAVAPQLIESELFGHERGSFTGAERLHKGYFERASGGTLFLDEITEMPADLQVKLLRVLETSVFVRVGGLQPVDADVRIVAATNRDPARAVAEGRLRDDLYHRLNVFPIELPPLRERGSDVEQLALFFLEELNQLERTDKSFGRETLARLREQPWPGNVRELRNYVQRSFILADRVLEGDTELAAGGPEGPESSTITIRVGTALQEVERRVTLATLAHCGNVKRRAAQVLGVSLKTLYNRLEHYGAREADGHGAQEPSPLTDLFPRSRH